ncbi:FAD/NAD(P)-binding protein [Vibrio tetraodonis]|uniref:FAD/NAD(P)-binding protein n=1 Tax=Vibrio tetraodonis TaxID=2231647 RepID=UPI000E0A0EE3|nr:FAD/NAD(P)-binding protein [Vibrio tetraodonis]
MNTIGIIGSGAGCIAILKSLCKHNVCNLKIYIFSEDHSQVGYAYKKAPDFFIMNTRLDSLTQFDEIISVQKWLQSHNYFFSDDDYIPRSVYGKYLQDVKENLFLQLENSSCVLELIEKADYIDNAGKIVSDGKKYNVDTTIVSIGFGSDLLNDRLFSAIQSCDSSRPIKIYGSGLTAIDLILYAHSMHPNSSIECVSYSGRFPRVRSQFKSGEGSLFEGFSPGNFGLSNIIKNFNGLLKDDIEKSIIYDEKFSLIDEIRYCESNIPEWQKVIYSSTPSYCKVYQSLRKKEQLLIHKMKSRIIENRAMFPLKNARKVWNLINNKQLKISKGYYSGEPSTGNEFLAFNTTKTTPFLTFSKLPKHDITGVNVDNNCKVIDSRNIYCLGPLTNGSRFFTEATSLTVRDASIIVDNILMQHGHI